MLHLCWYEKGASVWCPLESYSANVKFKFNTEIVPAETTARPPLQRRFHHCLFFYHSCWLRKLPWALYHCSVPFQHLECLWEDPKLLRAAIRRQLSRHWPRSSGGRGQRRWRDSELWGWSDCGRRASGHQGFDGKSCQLWLDRASTPICSASRDRGGRWTIHRLLWSSHWWVRHSYWPGNNR